MSMTTQCPSCSTRFRVTPQQLQAQHGSVRCGRCATVFDGFKSLATLVDAAPAAAPQPAPADVVVADDGARVAVNAGSASATSAPPAAPILELPPAFAGMPLPEIPQPVAEAAAIVVPPACDGMPLPRIPQPEPVVVAQVAVAAASAPLPEPPPAAIQPDTRVEPVVASSTTTPRRRGAVWAFGSLLLLCALAAQYVYLYRGEIAAAAPDLRPQLVDWCQSFGCTIDLPQRPRQISIEASDMQAADVANPGLVILTATLRNQAAVTLGYPALDVVLTNTREHTVARRIFLPAEYLAGNRDWRVGLPPSAEVTIRLNIDSGDLGAAGFRLDLMAAPAG